jgi:hypothetical protein
MPLVLKDRVQETATANTTVSFTLLGAVTGFQSFSSVGDTNTTYYAATDASGNWEVGVGTYSTSGPTLTRTTILSSSTGSAITFSGTVNVFVTYPAGESVNYEPAGGVVITESGSADALRITNTGTGNSLTIEDAANPDASPFVVDKDGAVLVGRNWPPLPAYTYQGQIGTYSTDASTNGFQANTYVNSLLSSNFIFAKSRGTTIGSVTSVNNGDLLGMVRFFGADGTDFSEGAYMYASVDGTPGFSDMPGRLGFATTPDGSRLPVTRMTIDSTGILRLHGTTSGTVGLKPAAAAGSTVYTLPAADGSLNQVLATDGAGTLSWSTPASSITITNDTSTNATYYPTFVTATSGSTSGVRTSSTKLTYRPSTGRLSSTSLSGTDVYGTTVYAGGSTQGTITSGNTSISGTTATVDVDITNYFVASTQYAQTVNVVVLAYTYLNGNTTITPSAVFSKSWTISVYYNGTTFVLGTGALYGATTAAGASAAAFPPGAVQALKALLVVNAPAGSVLLRFGNINSPNVNTLSYYAYLLQVVLV